MFLTLYCTLEASTYSILVLTTVTGHVTAAANALESPPDKKAWPEDSSPCLFCTPLLLVLYIASLMNSKAKKCTPTPSASRVTVGDVPLHSPLQRTQHCVLLVWHCCAACQYSVPNALLLHYNAESTWSASQDTLAGICLQTCAHHVKRLHTSTDHCSRKGACSSKLN